MNFLRKVFSKKGQQKQLDTVHFNVGGKIYYIKFSDLQSKGPNYLTKLVEDDYWGRIPARKDKYGNILIERNGDLFGVIVDYLRTSKLRVPKNVSNKDLMDEMQYFQIPTENLFVDHPKVSAPAAAAAYG